MNATRAIGQDAAKSTYETFGDTPALVVSRYDRGEVGGQIVRTHQEDLCQALRLWPANKYPGKDGPTAARTVDVARIHAHAPRPV